MRDLNRHNKTSGYGGGIRLELAGNPDITKYGGNAYILPVYEIVEKLQELQIRTSYNCP